MKAKKFGWLLLSLLLAKSAMGGVSIGLSGSAASNNLGIEKGRSNSVSANLNLDLTEFLRIGLTHRRSFDSGNGYKKLKDASGNDVYVEFESESRSVTNSMDLIVVLYNGTVSPYIFGGIGRKDYYSEMNCASLCSSAPLKGTLFPVPNYGFGVGIYLSREFSLKISQTYSVGVTTKLEDGAPAVDPETGKEKMSVTQDTYTQIGINYQL